MKTFLGSGKTLAFLVPLIERVLEENPTTRVAGNIRLLVIAPTRELAQQIGSTVEELLAFHSVISAGRTSPSSPFAQVVYGGTNIVAQIRKMERNGVPSILVATPGRLMELLDRKVRGRMFKKYLMLSQEVTTATSTNSNNYMMVVLDEADHVLSNFGAEMKLILKALPRKRQTLLFSATLSTKITGSRRGKGQPKNALPQETIMAEPIVGIQDIDCMSLAAVEKNKDERLKIVTNKKANPAVNLNVQEYCLTLPSMKFYLSTLSTILEIETQQENAKIVVFFPANKLVQFMAQAVVEAQPKMESLIHVIHSRMSQSSRQKASRAFSEEHSSVLFTSDVSARGMDYPNVTTVIQYGLPNRRELYLHRLGRTARAGHSGKGLLVAMPFERFSSLRLRKEGLKQWPQDTFDSARSSPKVVHSSKMAASAEAAYKAFVAYYVGSRHDKQIVLNAAQEFANIAGLYKLPELPEKLS